MGRKRGVKFNPEPLRALMDQAKIGPQRLGDCLSMNPSNIVSYLNGRANPSLDTIIAFADFFAVPLDYILGRCDLSTAEDVLLNYHDTFQSLRRVAYENVLQKAVLADNFFQYFVGYDYESPWPYNLVEQICADKTSYTDPIDWIITPKKETALESIIKTLTDREQYVIYSRFRDGVTLDELAEEFHLTRERIRQIQVTAIRKLRYPFKVSLLTEGVTLEEMTAKLEQLHAQIEEQTDILNELKNESFRILSERCLASTLLEDLDLSVRSFNCLKRNGINNVEDIVRFVEENGTDGIMNIRNFGKKSYDELNLLLFQKFGILLDKYKSVNNKEE